MTECPHCGMEVHPTKWDQCPACHAGNITGDGDYHDPPDFEAMEEALREKYDGAQG